jgi:hypothetical protein
MKKQLIIGGVIIVLLMLGFSGCFEDSNKDKENGVSPEAKLFIGTWKTSPYDVYENGTRYNETASNSTFYTNGTMGSESVEDNQIIWTSYTIENNQICFGDANNTEYLCYNYNFSDDGTQATLWTYVTNPYSDSGETIWVVVEMMKI